MESRSATRRKSESGNNRAAFIGGIIGNGVALFLVNMIPSWNLPFITGAYSEVVTLINISIIVQISGYFMLLFYHRSTLFHSANMVFGIFSIIALLRFIDVFPLDFSGLVGPWLNDVARIVLIIGVIGSVVSIVVHLIRMVASSMRRQEEEG